MSLLVSAYEVINYSIIGPLVGISWGPNLLVDMSLGNQLAIISQFGGVVLVSTVLLYTMTSLYYECKPR